MTWYEIIIAVAGAFGGIELIKYIGNMIFNRKNNSRIADTKATNAEIEVEKNKAIAEAEAKKALEEAHAVERRQYEERIADLHRTVDKLNEQLDGYVERDAAKEERFDKQTEKLREVQRMLLDTTMQVTDNVKHIGELELELEKKRCDYLKCPYRKPPTAHTPPKEDLSIDEYFKNKEDA